jgi:hypothetical protein
MPNNRWWLLVCPTWKTTRTWTKNKHHGEMVGLHSPANERSCVAHECCGRHLAVGDLVWFKREIMWIDYAGPAAAKPNFRYETVLKVVVIWDGVESCHVGFLSRHVVARLQKKNRLHEIFAQVLELYHDDEVAHVWKRKSIRNHGMALYRLIEQVLNYDD